MNRKVWKTAVCDKELAASISQEYDIPALPAYLAAGRGMTQPAELGAFFETEAFLETDPFSLPDMPKAAQRIWQAIDAGERIAVFGDYDTDGVTATAILYSYLQAHGADVIYEIPQRLTQGYGITAAAVEALAEAGVQVIVTVDNGITAHEAADKANELGLVLIVTDHHRPTETLPAAYAVVDAHRKDCTGGFREFAGAGVAFLLVCALEQGDVEMMLDEYADLAAIGTVGDVVRLTGENRTLVRYGLQLLNEAPRPGVRALLAAAGAGEKALSATAVAYQISPRINAAGRLGASNLALELLLCEDDETAQEMALQLQARNTERQALEKDITKQVIDYLENNPQECAQKMIIAAGEGWHVGVIGIVAAKIVELYGKPCIILSRSGDTLKGSGRSVAGFSLFDAIVSVSDCLSMFGGHPMAVGLTFSEEKYDEVRRRLLAFCDQAAMPFPALQIDCKLNPASVSLELAQSLEVLEPFGAGNPQPLFGLFGMRILYIRELSGGKHLKITFGKKDAQITALQFGTTLAEFPYRAEDTVDIAVTLEQTVYQGQQTLSLYLRAVKPSGTNEAAVLSGLRSYDAFLRGETLSHSAAQQALASRELTGKLYRHLQANPDCVLDPELLCARQNNDGSLVCAILLALDSLCELGLLQRGPGDTYRALASDQKLDLEQALTRRRLHTMVDTNA